MNYFIKHLLVDVKSGNFAQTMEWTAKSKDPKVVCHLALVLLADLVWSGVAPMAFFWREAWSLFSLLIFIVSQSLLETSAATTRSLASVPRYLFVVGRLSVSRRRSASL